MMCLRDRMVPDRLESKADLFTVHVKAAFRIFVYHLYLNHCSYPTIPIPNHPHSRFITWRHLVIRRSCHISLPFTWSTRSSLLSLTFCVFQLGLGKNIAWVDVGKYKWHLARFRHKNNFLRFRKSLVTLGFKQDINSPMWKFRVCVPLLRRWPPPLSAFYPSLEFVITMCVFPAAKG